MQNMQPEKHNNYNKLINLFFVVLILMGLGLIIYKNRQNLNDYKEILFNVNYLTLGFVLVVTMSTIFFRSWRWYYLLRPLKGNLSFMNVFRVSINALAANFTMPGKLGVPVKAVLLKKAEQIEVGKSLPSILGEIFIEHASELMIACIAVIIGGHLSKFFHAVKQIVHNQNIVINGMIVLAALAILFVGSWIFKRKIKSMSFIINFIETIKITRRRKDYLLYSILITIINLIISYYIFWLVIATLGHPEIDLTFVIFAGSITNFLSLISPIPGGVGVRELTSYGLYDFYFGLGGIAFLAIIIMRLITYLSLFITFLLERSIATYIFSKDKKELSVSS